MCTKHSYGNLLRASNLELPARGNSNAGVATALSSRQLQIWNAFSPTVDAPKGSTSLNTELHYSCIDNFCLFYFITFSRRAYIWDAPDGTVATHWFAQYNLAPHESEIFSFRFPLFEISFGAH